MAIGYTISRDEYDEIIVVEIKYESLVSITQGIQLFDEQHVAVLHQQFLNSEFFYRGFSTEVAKVYSTSVTKDGFLIIQKNHNYDRQFYEWVYNRTLFYLEPMIKIGFISLSEEYSLDTYYDICFNTIMIAPLTGERFFMYSELPTGPSILMRVGVTYAEAKNLLDRLGNS